MSGSTEVAIVAKNAAGIASEPLTMTISLLIDRTPPEITITKPFRHRSGTMDYLYIGPSDDLVTALTLEKNRAFARNVIGHGTAWVGQTSDHGVGLEEFTIKVFFR